LKLPGIEARRIDP